MTPLWEEFLNLSPAASLGIRLPSGGVTLSRALLARLRLSVDAMPQTLDQWRELCHPADHGQMQEMDRALADRELEAFSLTRRLYCGDGLYRPFRLEACVHRAADGTPLYLMGIETLLEPFRPEETDLKVPHETPGAPAFPEAENFTLRRALQRQALRGLARPSTLPPDEENRVALGVLGLAGSGRSFLMRVLRNEGFLPDGLVLTEEPGQGDIVLYTIPLRGRLRAADANLLNAAARGGQKIAVLLTMTDLERDETEAGTVLLSRRQRLTFALEDLREALERASVPPCSLIPLSSRLAWRGLYDRASPDWRASNFDALLQWLAAARLSTTEADLPSRVVPPAFEAKEGSSLHSGLFDALLSSLREQALRTRFLTLPAMESRRLVLMGLSRQEELGLISRLAHSASLSGGDAEAQDWLFFGRNEPPFPGGGEGACVRRPVALEGFDLLAAPANAFRPGEMEWEALFAEWTPVVHLDLIRVDSGLSELARMPWFPALASAPRWILAFAHGGLFDTRLPDLIEAEERVRRFAVLRGFQGRMSPFVYENYDPRYTDFLELGARVRFDSSAGELSALISDWGPDERDFAPPFTRDHLALALLGIRGKLRGIMRRIAR